MTTSTEERQRLVEQLGNKEFRDALVHADLTNRILFGLSNTLEERGWTQDELAERAGTSQPVINKYLKGYENFSLRTLERLASALDVSFTAGFERFSDLVDRHVNLEHEDLAIPAFDDDPGLKAQGAIYTDAAEGLTLRQSANLTIYEASDAGFGGSSENLRELPASGEAWIDAAEPRVPTPLQRRRTDGEQLAAQRSA